MDGKDQHFCIVCHETIWGLENYVKHRKYFCESDAQDSSIESFNLNASPSITYPGSSDPDLNETVEREEIVKSEVESLPTASGGNDLMLTEPKEEANDFSDLKSDTCTAVTEEDDLNLKTVTHGETADERQSSIESEVDVSIFIEESDGDSEDDLEMNDNPLIYLKTSSSGIENAGSEDSSEFGILSARQSEVVNNEGARVRGKHFNWETGSYDCKICEKQFRFESAFRRHCDTQYHKERFQKKVGFRKKKGKMKEVASEQDEEKPVEAKTEDIGKGKSCNEVHVCTVCDKKFVDVVQITEHLISASERTGSSIKEHFDMIMKYESEIIHSSPFCCKPCDFYCNTNDDLLMHVKSGDHLQAVDGDKIFECSICNIVEKDQNGLFNHLMSGLHKKEIQKKDKIMALSVVSDNSKRMKTYYFCGPCNVQFTNQHAMKSHIRLKEHYEKLSVAKQELSDKSLEKDRNVPEEPHIENNLGTEGSDSNSAADDSLVNAGLEMGLTFESEVFSTSQRKKTIGCKYCAFDTETNNGLRLHYMKVHKEMIKVCEPCDQIFPHGRGYKRHILSKEHQNNVNVSGDKNPEGKFECHVCRKKFADENYCKFHTAYYHFHAKTEEDVFDENSVTRQKYADFFKLMETSKNTESLRCPEAGCGVHVMKANMFGHLRKHTNEKPFRCNICDESFLNSSSLRRHLLAHFGCDERKCEICGKEFNSASTYNNHMKLHKAISSDCKSFICSTCGEAFYLMRQLRAHQKNHMERAYKCTFPDCTWAFKTPNALNRHLVTHSDSRHCVCTTCGYATKSMKYLLAHEKTHKESPQTLHECEYCEYKTANRYHMTRHTRIHLGTKPFKCPYCAYSCNTHANLRKHILETNFHKGLNMYPCKLCDYSTNCTKDFRVHLLKQHKEVENNDRSLAAFVGLFRRSEDVERTNSVALPLRGRVSSRRKYKDKNAVVESPEAGEEHRVEFQYATDIDDTISDFDSGEKMKVDVEYIPEESIDMEND